MFVNSCSPCNKLAQWTQSSGEAHECTKLCVTWSISFRMLAGFMPTGQVTVPPWTFTGLTSMTSGRPSAWAAGWRRWAVQVLSLRDFSYSLYRINFMTTILQLCSHAYWNPLIIFSAVTSIRGVMVINCVFLFRKSRRITTRLVRELGESSTRKSELLWPMSARETSGGWSARWVWTPSCSVPVSVAALELWLIFSPDNKQSFHI